MTFVEVITTPFIVKLFPMWELSRPVSRLAPAYAGNQKNGS
jgi:hypothetical protein